MADSDRKARSAEEYLGMREELLKEKANLQEQMQDMRTQFDLQMSEVERQHVQDRYVADSILWYAQVRRLNTHCVQSLIYAQLGFRRW